MDNQKKVCVVGVGYWGKNYIKTLSNLSIPFSIVEKNTKVIIELKKEYPKIDFYNNIEDSFENHDSYIIVTPPITHYEIGMKCLNHNKNVLIEKPLTLNPEDSELLYKKAKDVNKTLAVGHLLLFHPAIRLIKEYIDNKDLGNLQYIYSNRLNLGKVRQDENVLWSLAPHDISIIQFLLNFSYPNKIQCIGSKIANEKMHDITTTFLEYSDQNVDAHIFVNWLNPFKDHSLVVVGDKKMITFNGVTNELLLHHKFLNKENFNIESIDVPVEKIDYEFDYPLTLQIKHFLSNKNNPNIEYIGGKEAIDVMNILNDASSQLL
tara:strand:- start:1493 stop:2452 length:960 start_codon:yes stop_codon:yes gene_type:complete